jgi:hypothetical protein
MAKRKKKSKVQKRGKLRRGNSATRGKARKSSRAKAAKQTVAKAKTKRTPVKKTARRIEQPVVTVETVAVEAIERPAADVITVIEVEDTRKAS